MILYVLQTQWFWYFKTLEVAKEVIKRLTLNQVDFLRDPQKLESVNDRLILSWTCLRIIIVIFVWFNEPKYQHKPHKIIIIKVQ